MAESKEELKNLLMKVKEESENVSLKKLNIQKIKIMASSSITLWQIDGETVETVAAFIFMGKPGVLHAVHGVTQRVRHGLVTEQQQLKTFSPKWYVHSDHI